MYIAITNIDSETKILCTEAPMRNGPALPDIKGFQYDWNNQSIYPIDCNSEGIYLETPLYYGTCDDDADISLTGVVTTLTIEEYNSAKTAEYAARWEYINTTVIEKSVSATVATLTTHNQDGSPNGFQVGNEVMINGIDATFDGTYIITDVTDTSFSYELTAADLEPTTVDPVGFAQTRFHPIPTLIPV